ncbi:MAG TPA: hypothetical protein VFC51_08660 [Chloroflexota bacterium]|nr:hypothetical protein [Chloroflexota bacterium]
MRFLSTVASVVMLGSMALAPVALADDGDHDRDDRDSRTNFTVTLTATSATPGQLYADGLGNRYYQGASFTGQVSGWPFDGTFRLDADMSFSDAASGDLDGSIVLTDRFGNTAHGNIDNGTVSNPTGVMTIDARIRFDGGTGAFDGANGRARITGSLPPIAQPAAFSPSYLPQYQMYAPPGPVLAQAPYAPYAAAGSSLTLTGRLNLADQSGWDPQRFWQSQSSLRTALNDWYANPSGGDRPGNGWGDDNHRHSGPPGRSHHDHDD